MSFFNPLAFWLAPLAAAIIALYLMKVRRRRQPVSTLLFWKSALEQKRRRALFHRLRALLSLLLQLLIFALLLLALARPEWRAFFGERGARVIVLDNRLNALALTEDGGPVWDEAVEQAVAFANRASSRRPVSLVAASPEPRALVPFSPQPAPLLETLEKLEPGAVGGSPEAALEFARQLLETQEGTGRVFWISNLPAGDEPHSLESRRENLAITTLQARRLFNSASAGEAFVELANFTRAPRQVELAISRDGALFDVRPIELQPGEKKEVIAEIEFPGASASATFTARFEAGDALPQDNEAEVTLPPAQKLEILLVSSGNHFLETYLEADRTLAHEILAPETFQPSLAAMFDAVIFDDAPADAQLLAQPGNYLFLNRAPLPAGEVRPAVVGDSQREHPILRHASWSRLEVAKAAPFQPPQAGNWQWQSLVDDAAGGSLLLAGGSEGGSRAVALAFSLQQTNFPLQPAFPVFLHNALHWLAGSGDFEIAAMQRPPDAPSDLRVESERAPALPESEFLEMLERQPFWIYLALAGFILLLLEWFWFHRRITE